MSCFSPPPPTGLSLYASASDPSAAIGKAGRPPNSPTPPLFPAIRTGSLRSVALPLPRVLFVAQVKEGEGGGALRTLPPVEAATEAASNGDQLSTIPPSPPFGTAAGQQTDSEEEEEEEERVTLKTAAKEKRGAGKCIVF